MATVIGTETEFGISIRNSPDFNPALASGLVINCYRGEGTRVQWSYEEESPGRDLRGFGVDTSGDYDSGVVNVVLGNGARLYVDHAHPEYSGPECADALSAALYDKAGEFVMAEAAANAGLLVRPGEIVSIYKNNSDNKGNSYGAHENYLISRLIPFGQIVDYLTGFLVSRQPLTGAGKLGSENERPEATYQITQRADFFEERVGLETTLKRPIINTRDEPHGDAEKYRRLHVIIGDATLSEVQTFVKLGTTALFLAALEDGFFPEALELEDPVTACWQVSHDLDMTRSYALVDGSSMTALQMQNRYYEWLAKYAEQTTDNPVTEQVLVEWRGLLDDLEVDPSRTADRLDWVAKRSLMEAYVDRGAAWDDPRLAAINLQYHDVASDKSLFRKLQDRGRIRRLFTDDQVRAAAAQPPEDTRAYFRGRCVTKYGEKVVAANWDSLVFDASETHLKRVPMMEPLLGTKELVSELIDTSDTVQELLQGLGGH